MKILIVDDSMAMRLIVQRALREAGFGDHDLRQAEDGAQALEVVLEEEPDVVLSDWNMPNMNGPELLQALNNEGCDPVFGFVTTEGTPAMREKATKLGAKFLIAKPFSAKDFEVALGHML